ncbi:MAG TPA: ABC transporter ATP-binding protein [Acidimicrobiales bacterium]|nr:ABC transporter ATP-binding protein [Acidimicrobiales bacterium]
MSGRTAEPGTVGTPQPAAPEAGGWIVRLWPFMRAHRHDVRLAFGMSMAGMAVTAITPVVQKVIVDDVITNHSRALAPWLALLVAAGLFGFVAAYIRRFVGGRVALAVQFDLRNAVYERLQRLDFASHDQLQTGQLVSRASSDVALIQGLLSFLPIMLGNALLVVLALVVMVVLSPPLTLVVLAALPAMLVVALKLRTSIFPASWDAQQRAAEVAGVVDEAVSGVRVVKGFGQEERQLGELAGTGASLFRSRLRLIRLTARFTPTLQLIPVLGQVGVLAVGGWLAIEGRITLGTLLAFASYLVQLVAPVRMFASLLAVGQQARAGAERLLDLLDANPLVTERPGAPDLVVTEGAVRLEGVRFGYTKDARVLDGFDLEVAPGETVALVGTSGSGKSTVALLLPRFYDADAGAVTIDGMDVRDVTLDSLRRQVGVVFEEPFLFSDTVRANLAYGRPDATDAELEAAAEAAEADGFIGALPDGWDTVVGERGLTLSGGQRQRVALARALVTDPRVLVLDDATSSIDARTEEEIHAALRSTMAGRTTLLIAHRRSTLRLASRIVLVDGGRVADSGTHEELLARSPMYRALFTGPGDALVADPADVASALPGDGAVAAGAEGSRVPVRIDGDGRHPGVARRDGHGGTTDGDRVGGITPSAWPDRDPAGGPVPVATVSAAPRIGPPGGGGGGGAMPLSATPELLAALDQLPPADDELDVDVTREASPDERFRLREFLRPYRRWLALGFGLVAVDSVLLLIGPLMVRRGVDDGVGLLDQRALNVAALVFLAAALADWGVTRTYTLVTGRTAERLLYALRIRVFAHLQRLSLDFYDREMAGRVMTRMTTDIEALQQLLQTGLVNAIVSLATCVGVLGFLVVLSPPLALAAASVLPPLALATWWYRRRSGALYATARERIATVNANFQESLSGVRVAQAYTREDRNIAGFREVNDGYLQARLGAQRLIALYFPFVLLLSDVGSAVVLGTGSALVAHDVVTAGVVIAFVLYLNQFFSPIQQLSQVFDTWQQARASMDRIDELMATPTGTPPAAHPVDPGRLRGEVAFEGVRFRYPNTAGEEALTGVDLVIAPGETVALVGETGAGKSTIVKLVARFYDPTKGRVAIDGHDLRELDLNAYRKQLGVVPQEAFLFTGTIRDNIAFGRPEASDAQVEAAARAVGAHDFVARLPGGYLEPVSERGRSMSAGQRQLIALARARLVDPAILLLDEATSNLDLATEAAVQAAMGVVATGRTTLLVAHRLPTARGADRIAVIDGGRIVAVGPHDELVATSPAYADLWAAFRTEATAA